MGRPVSLVSARAGDMIEVTAFLAEAEGGYRRTSEIGAAMGVGRKELCETLRYLVHVGIVESRRGRAGGYRLAVDPRTLTIWDLVERTEAATGIGSRRACYGRWRHAMEGMRTAMRSVTIAQLVESEPNRSIEQMR